MCHCGRGGCEKSIFANRCIIARPKHAQCGKLTARSTLADTIRRPSRENATDFTKAECPVSVWISPPPSTLHIFTLPSHPLDTNRRPSGENATEEIELP